MIKLFVVGIERSQLYKKFNGKTDAKDEVNTEIKNTIESSSKNINYNSIVELLYSMMIFDNENN